MDMTQKAGRELDAEIARRVMGWERYRLAPYLPQTEAAANRCWHRRDNPAPITLPNFSTEIADAFRIVEQMQEHGYYFCVEWVELPKNQPRWRAWFGKFNVDGDSGPHAICLAALSAVNAEAAHV